MRRSARQRLGQHFLIDPVVAARMVESMALDPERDVVVEIGPGRGALTGMLATKCAKLVAIELDFRLAGELHRKFEPLPNVEIRHGDFLKQDLRELWQPHRRLRLIGNIPYSLTSPIILRILQPANRELLFDATLTLQREVAERVVAAPSTKGYGVLSVLSQVLATPEVLFAVPPRAFRPRPRVSSSVVRWRNLQPPKGLGVDERTLRKLVRAAFGQRRKMLRNCLAWLGGDALSTLAASGWDLSRRPEDLSPRDWVELTRLVQRITAEQETAPGNEVEASPGAESESG